MNRTSVLVCAILSAGLAAWAGGKSYDVNLYRTVTAGGIDLQPGAYTLNVENDKATFHRGKIAAANAVRLETVGEKYLRTTMVLDQGGEKTHIREIHLGGTKTKLVFTETQP